MNHKPLLIMGLLHNLAAVGSDSKSNPAPELTLAETIRQLEEIRSTPSAIPTLSLAYLNPKTTPAERQAIEAQIAVLEVARNCWLAAIKISLNPSQARSDLVQIYKQTKSPFAAGLLLDPRLEPRTPEQESIIISAAAALHAEPKRPRSATEPAPYSAAQGGKVAQTGHRYS